MPDQTEMKAYGTICVDTRPSGLKKTCIKFFSLLPIPLSKELLSINQLLVIAQDKRFDLLILLIFQHKIAWQIYSSQ
jgi:hypothetical protein